MGLDDIGTAPGIPGSSGTVHALEGIGIGAIVKGLVKDLEDLRAGRITVVDARARAKLAHEALRGVGQIIAAQRFIEAGMKMLPNPDGTTPAAKPRGRKRSKVIDAE